MRGILSFLSSLGFYTGPEFLIASVEVYFSNLQPAINKKLKGLFNMKAQCHNGAAKSPENMMFVCLSSKRYKTML